MSDADANQHAVLLWINRAKAIEAYSILEQSTASLFANLMHSPPDRAGTVFFKINSSTTKIAILDKLLRRQFGATYSAFWNSYLGQLRTIDLKRNEIIHWTTLTHLGEAGVTNVTLVPPSIWNLTPESPQITKEDLATFAAKCNVFARLCNMFIVCTFMAQIEGFDSAAWLAIFKQPLVYPLPEGHPLNQPPQAPEPPPQS